MADVTKITLPDGTTKNIKDATARAQANWNTNNGVKNLLNFGEDRTVSGSGTLKYILSNGVVTVNGTPTSDDFFNLEFTGIGGERVLTGCPSGGGGSTYMQRIFSSDGAVAAAYDYGEGSNTYNYNANVSYKFSIRIKSGYTANNLVFRPMLRPAFADTTFEPYALPNTKITPELIELVDSGAKNLYNPSNTSTSTSGLTGTITRNSDGSYTISGTTSGTVYYYMGSWITPEDGYYILSGGSAAESASQLIYDNHDWQTYESNNKKKLAYWTKGSTHRLYIRLGTGITISNVTFYPMICTKAAWDVSQKFVPYRPSYEETVGQVAENENNILLNGLRICAQWKNTKQAEVYAMSLTDFVRDTPTGVTMGTYIVVMQAYAANTCGIYTVSFNTDSNIATYVNTISALGSISTLTVNADREIEIPLVSSTYGAKVTIYALL